MAQTKKSLEAQLLRLLKLPSDVSIDSSKVTTDTEIITLRLPADHIRICPNCGSDSCIFRGSGTWQNIKHFPIEGRRIILRVFKHRLYCPECGVSHYETPDWIIPRLRMTKALFKSIMIDFSEMTAFTQISSDLMISETTVRSVFDSIEIRHPDRLPTTLCIDEFHADSDFYVSSRKKWATDDYNVNITDWNNHAVVDVLQQKNLAFLSKYFRQQYSSYQRERVLYFVCDMSGSFISLAKECFPHANHLY